MISLFDKLGQHIDITAGRNAEAPMHPPNTPAQHTPEIQDVMMQKSLLMYPTHEDIHVFH